MSLPQPWPLLLAYLAVISVISVLACLYDKAISGLNKVKLRIPEKSLFLWSLLGGSLAMYVTMCLVRHKTKHLSFMIGIPLILILQIALIVWLVYAQILPSPF